MRKPKVFDIGDQCRGQLAVRKPAIAFLGPAPPGAEMDFVDGHRARIEMTDGALAHPFLVTPSVMVDATYDRGRGRWTLGAGRNGIGLERQQPAVPRLDLIFVALAFFDARDEDLPNTRRGMEAHRMTAAVPQIEVADHAHPAGIRRPNREHNAVNILDAHKVRAQPVISLKMRAFTQQVDIDFTEPRVELIRIDNFLGSPIADNVQPVWPPDCPADDDFEEPVALLGCLCRDDAARRVDHSNGSRAGLKRTDHHASVAEVMRSEIGKRIARSEEHTS